MFKQAEDMEDDFRCSDLKTFELPFWLTCLSCMCTFIAIVNAIFIGCASLQRNFGFDEIEAGYWFTIPYAVSAVFSPITGLFVEKFGNRMTVCIVGSTIMMLAHAL